MTLDLKQNYFELFDLPLQFSLDKAALTKAFLTLQSQWHPDRFANGSDEDRRISMQNTSFINAAYDALKSPRLRARYLLKLSGTSFDDEVETSNDPLFLMQQMELRESIEDASEADEPFDELDRIKKKVKALMEQFEQSFQASYEAGDYKTAKSIVLKMRFMERIFDEVRRLEEKLEEHYY